MSLPVDGAWSASPVKATSVNTRTRRLIMVVGWRVDGVLAGSSCTRALAALGNGGESARPELGGHSHRWLDAVATSI